MNLQINNKNFFENIATYILKKYFKNKYSGLKRMPVGQDKPDLQSIISNVGVEVTLICKQEYIEASTIFSQLNEICDNKKTKKISRIQQLVDYGNGFIIENYSLIDIEGILVDSYNKKSQKLNNGYKIFERNELFFINELQNIDQDMCQTFLKIIKDNKTNSLMFDTIYILNCFNKKLFIINLSEKDKGIESLIINDLEKIAKKAKYEFVRNNL